MGEIANEFQYERSVELLDKWLKTVEFKKVEFKKKGYTEEEIKNLTDPELSFLEGIKYEIKEYEMKKLK